MGSQTFSTYGRGKTIKEAYKNAVDDATYEHGHQEGYSGAINATPGFKDVTAEFKSSGKNMIQYINEQLDKLSKYDGARAICIEQPIENKNKIKTQVEHVVTPGTKKWVLMYVVYHYENRVISAPTKGEAVKLAREYSEKHQCTTTVKMEKVLEKKDTAIVAKITYKKSSNEREGKWLFFGWASC